MNESHFLTVSQMFNTNVRLLDDADLASRCTITRASPETRLQVEWTNDQHTPLSHAFVQKSVFKSNKNIPPQNYLKYRVGNLSRRRTLQTTTFNHNRQKVTTWWGNPDADIMHQCLLSHFVAGLQRNKNEIRLVFVCSILQMGPPLFYCSSEKGLSEKSLERSKNISLNLKGKMFS